MRAITALKLAYRGLILGEEYSRYTLAEKISELIYPKYKYSDYGRLYLEDSTLIENYSRLTTIGFNWHSLDRKFILDQLTNAILHIQGDTAECGSFEGASSWFICNRTKGHGKDHHIFDSFEGLSEPGAKDGTHWSGGALAVQQPQVAINLGEFKFVKYYKGWIPSRFEEVSSKRFSFVHIDVDLYQPTLDSLSFFYERMSPGGMIVCDDYGFTTCPGAKKALDEYLNDKPEKIIQLATGQALVIKQ